MIRKRVVNLRRLKASSFFAMEKFRSFEIRLKEYSELKKYKIIADTNDFIIFEDSDGRRIYTSGEALHWVMLSEGIL